MRRTSFAVLLLILWAFMIACSNKPSEPASSSPGPAAAPGAQPTTAQPSTAPTSEPAKAAPAQRAAAKPQGETIARQAQSAAKPAATAPAALPAGTVLTVRLGQTVGSKISRPGDKFDATLAEPLEANGTVLIPKGAQLQGTVQDAAPLGRFKGGARLRLTLDAVTVNGKQYPIQTTSIARSEKGKGKRTAVMTGGGAGVGALIGGLAGGGKGAAIGAIAGAGAGGAGAAFTGNKDIVLPAESALSFKLEQPVEIK
jgi:hypothetical protein